MLHHSTSHGNHWAVSWTGEQLPGKEPSVLIQVQEEGNQARIPLTPEHARYMAAELIRFAERVETADPLPLP